MSLFNISVFSQKCQSQITSQTNNIEYVFLFLQSNSKFKLTWTRHKFDWVGAKSIQTEGLESQSDNYTSCRWTHKVPIEIAIMILNTGQYCSDQRENEREGKRRREGGEEEEDKESQDKQSYHCKQREFP